MKTREELLQMGDWQMDDIPQNGLISIIYERINHHRQMIQKLEELKQKAAQRDGLKDVPRSEIEKLIA